MRVGLLVCDHVREELVHIAGDYTDMFATLVGDRAGLSLTPYDVINGEVPDDPTECEAWITTGSRHSVNDDLPWIRKLEEFVRRMPAAGTPLIGVCFGHQLIARAMGGRVVRSARGWGVGSVEVELIDGGSRPAWMQPARDSYRLLNSHADQVEVVPEGGLVLGSTDHCPVSLMSVGDHLLGIQGHPEMGVAYLRGLIESRRGNRIPEVVAAKALESLELGSDSKVVMTWMSKFMTRRSESEAEGR